MNDSAWKGIVLGERVIVFGNELMGSSNGLGGGLVA